MSLIQKKYPFRNSVAAICFLLAACDPGQNTSTSTTTTVEDSTATASLEATMAGSSTMNTLTEQEKADGWQLLFDGQSTAGWRGYNKQAFPEKGWEVKDGMLTVLKAEGETAAGGDIITEKQYENFDLQFEFKITQEANSGILYRVKEIPNAPGWHSGPEYQVIDNQGWTVKDPSFNMATHRTGDNYDLHAAPGDYSKPVGEWNQGRVMVNNGKVEHWLNGQKTIEYDFNSTAYKDVVKKSKFAKLKEYGANKKGHIGIQEHGATVYYRNIKIKEL
jgi:hypothetical protein